MSSGCDQSEWGPNVDKTQLCLRLADRSSARFESRRSMEWNTHFGLWALLGGGSAAVMSTEWSPSGWLFFLTAVSVIILLIVYSLYFLPWLARSLERDMKTSYYWETAALRFSGLKHGVPTSLQSGNKESGTRWPNAQEMTENDWATGEFLQSGNCCERHPVQHCQLAMTVFVGAFLLLVMFDKYQKVSSAGSRIQFESARIEGMITVVK